MAVSNDEKFKEMLQGKKNQALAELVKNQNFRFYMAEILGFCRTFENAFDEKGNVAAFNNGRQSVGQKIFLDIMSADPEQYIVMCKEEAELLAMRDQMKKESKTNADNGQAVH